MKGYFTTKDTKRTKAPTPEARPTLLVFVIFAV